MEKTTEINVPYPAAGDLHLRIAVGACRFRIVPGAYDAWVRGTYHDPTDGLPIRVVEQGAGVEITQERDSQVLGGLLQGGTPTLELGLGTNQPYRLTIEGGASENTFDLGGLPLTRLVLKQGGGKFTIDFSSPNPAAMDLLDLDVGAGAIELRHLAHANAAEITINGGAAAYVFDFGGIPQRDMYTKINTGVSSVEIAVPAATAARIRTEAVLGSVEVGDGLTRQEGAFWTPAAVRGVTPLLTVEASVAVGSLRLRTT